MKAGILMVALLTSALATAQPGETEQAQKLVWTCPLHREVTENEAGQCELCERQLVQTLVQLAWWCPIQPAKKIACRSGSGSSRSELNRVLSSVDNDAYDERRKFASMASSSRIPRRQRHRSLAVSSDMSPC